MNVTVVVATDEHRSAVATAMSARVQRLVERVPLVPATFADPATVERALASLDDGLFVAFDGHQVVGHLGWHDLSDVRRTGRPGAWMPEFAHSATSDDVRDALFAAAADAWAASGREVLMASMLVDDDGVGWWHLNGFGTFLHDTVLAAAPLAHSPITGATVRAATTGDAAALAALDVEHCAHYASPPTFMVPPTPWSEARWAEYIVATPTLTQVAFEGDEACGFVRVEFDSADLPLLAASTSATVTGIFVRPGSRTSGVGAALLSHVAAAAGAAGAQVLTADHETTNPTARRFWPHHATTVAVSVMRMLERR